MRRIPLVACLALAACARPEETTLPFAESFEEAELRYGIPRSILVGIASTESGMVMRSANDKQPCYGVMGLCEEDTLAAAARLLKVPADSLRTDPRLNILGAAAVLAEHLRAAGKAGWEEALRRFGARGSPEAAEIFAREVLRLAARDLGVATSEAELRPDSRLARWVPAVNYSRANRGRGQIRKIVIHTAQGSYAGTIAWFRNPRSQVSAHYVVRSRDGEITQMVEEKDIAWHVRCWNSDTIGIEHEGFVDDPGTWYTDAMYRRSAALVREVAARYGIPLDRDHILGHNDVSRLSGHCTTHTDPGRGWDWDRYMALLRGSGAPAPAPSPRGRLRGVVYDASRPLSDPANRIAGATVRLSTGATLTTGDTGAFTFRLPPGTYTATAAKAGWGTASVSRRVTADDDTWGSIAVRRNVAMGRYLGVVYDASRSLSDPANRLAGVTVCLSNGMTVTTGTSGLFNFRVPAGRYTAAASRSGWRSASTTRDVSANGEVWGSIGIRR